MPLKMQYPVQLHKDTKCPACGNSIIELHPFLYSCQGGHVLEGIVLVTMRQKPKQEPVKVNPGLPSDDPIVPDYNKKGTAFSTQHDEGFVADPKIRKTQ
jgi:hypothetical protein